jgi:hypothetical protein
VEWCSVGKALGHGVAQGGFSELRGGSFRAGFIGGAVGKIGGSFVHANISESMQPIGILAVAGIAVAASGGDSRDAYLSAAVSAVTVYLYNELGTWARSYDGYAKIAEAEQPINEVKGKVDDYLRSNNFRSGALGFLANRADNITTGCLLYGLLPCAATSSTASIVLSSGSAYYDYQEYQNINAAAAAGVGMDLALGHIGDVAGHLGGGKARIVIDSAGNVADFLMDEAAANHRR